MIDIAAQRVHTLAGNGAPGYSGDGSDARSATFGSDPTAQFDGPISLSLDEAGNAYVGDRFNHVVRMIERDSGIITTIAGRPDIDSECANDPAERDLLRVNLPEISSMDYSGMSVRADRPGRRIGRPNRAPQVLDVRGRTSPNFL